MVGKTISHYKVLEKIGQKFISLKYELGLELLILEGELKQ